MKTFPAAVQISQQQVPTDFTPGGPASECEQITERTQLMRKPHHGLRKTSISKPMQRNQSTGPKTTRRNAMRHGLTAATVVTAIEDGRDFVLATGDRPYFSTFQSVTRLQ